MCVCVCVCVCACLCLYVYIYVFMYVCMSPSLLYLRLINAVDPRVPARLKLLWEHEAGTGYVCVYVYMYVCMYVCMFVCMYVCMYVCVCLYVYICVCMYICMCVCVCLCMHGSLLYLRLINAVDPRVPARLRPLREHEAGKGYVCMCVCMSASCSHSGLRRADTRGSTALMSRR